MSVAVLCTRRKSVYEKIRGTECWSVERDAWLFGGAWRVIAHPPCRLWGRLSQFCVGSEVEFCREIALGLWCARWVGVCGGVLEQPAGSRLFKYAGLPYPGGAGPGFTICVPQRWWGHRSRKETWLWFSGGRPSDLPVVPFRLEPGVGVGSGNGLSGSVRRMWKGEREATPELFAKWLVDAVCALPGALSCSGIGGEEGAAKQKDNPCK